jgi:xylulokinase
MKTIGIDIGTSGAKGLLVEFPEGRILASAKAGYALHGEGNRAEHDPEDWMRAVESILSELGPADAIGLDGMMHSEVCLERTEGGGPAGASRAILWCDGRAEEACREIEERIGLEELRRSVANRPFAGFTLPHLLWRDRLGTVLVCKDYVRYRLTGDLRQEASDASGTLCWDVARGGWATRLLESLGIDPELFPAPCGSTEVVGEWKGIPVVGGAADNAAAAVGVGVVRPGQALVSMGTSNVLLVVHDEPRVDAEMRVHTFTHAVPGRFLRLGCMLTGTRALDWALRLFGETVESAPIAESSEGVLFAPYLVGERTPHADTRVRGIFAGLGPDHDRSHLLRAVMEGTAFALRDAHAIAGGESVRVTGGGMRNALWRQIVADVLEVPVITVNTGEEGAAFGSTILAAVGVGAFGSIEEACDRVVRETSVTRPERSYREAYARFRRLWPAARSLAE